MPNPPEGIPILGCNRLRGGEYKRSLLLLLVQETHTVDGAMESSSEPGANPIGHSALPFLPNMVYIGYCGAQPSHPPSHHIQPT
jgi:hypothetical protein